ncbi:hypothetical protein [Methylomonas sp. AM2-LC]|uniref:hypothetical protein n=1 Tax=Methylomonas sp. AM2-LC TaxID=3153301 RepID=UPI003264B821
MEFVIVSFKEDRTVLADGEELGQTNETLNIGAGHHIFSLSNPQNYQPLSVTVNIQGTTSLAPFIVKFQ